MPTCFASTHKGADFDSFLSSTAATNSRYSKPHELASEIGETEKVIRERESEELECSIMMVCTS